MQVQRSKIVLFKKHKFQNHYMHHISLQHSFLLQATQNAATDVNCGANPVKWENVDVLKLVAH